jgi:hypothetical protein
VYLINQSVLLIIIIILCFYYRLTDAKDQGLHIVRSYRPRGLFDCLSLCLPERSRGRRTNVLRLQSLQKKQNEPENAEEFAWGVDLSQEIIGESQHNQSSRLLQDQTTFLCICRILQRGGFGKPHGIGDVFEREIGQLYFPRSPPRHEGHERKRYFA